MVLFELLLYQLLVLEKVSNIIKDDSLYDLCQQPKVKYDVMFTWPLAYTSILISLFVKKFQFYQSRSSSVIQW